jgi:hypothetical protein
MVILLCLIGLVHAGHPNFYLKGESSEIHLQTPEASFTIRNYANFTIYRDSDSILTFKDCDSGCELSSDRKLFVHGNLYATYETSFETYNVKQWKLAALEDFQGKMNGWSKQDISNCGSNPDIFLGGHCKFAGTYVSKSFQLPSHTEVTVKVNFHFIDKWEGESAYMKIDGRSVWAQAYSACIRLHSSTCQLYGVNVCGGDYPDRISYPVEFTGKHSESSISLEFGSNIEKDPCEASWGIDDVEIYIR